MPYEYDGHAQQGSYLEAAKKSARFRFPFLVATPEGLLDVLRLGGGVNAVPGGNHGLPDGIPFQGSGSILYTRGFGGETDVYVSNTGNTGHRIFHTPDARGTSHAGDRNLLGEERGRRTGFYRRRSRNVLRER